MDKVFFSIQHVQEFSSLYLFLCSDTIKLKPYLKIKFTKEVTIMKTNLRLCHIEINLKKYKLLDFFNN